MNNELYHYGVKGMKWGVRRATRAKTVYGNKAQKQYTRNTKLANTSKEILAGYDYLDKLVGNV